MGLNAMLIVNSDCLREIRRVTHNVISVLNYYARFDTESLGMKSLNYDVPPCALQNLNIFAGRRNGKIATCEDLHCLAKQNIFERGLALNDLSVKLLCASTRDKQEHPPGEAAVAVAAPMCRIIRAP